METRAENPIARLYRSRDTDVVGCIVCRNQAYAACGYSQPPSIENAASHPFLKELEAKEAGGSATPEEAGRTAAAQPSAAPKPSAVAAKPLQPPASTAKPAPVAAPQPAQLFDLLSLHDVSIRCSQILKNLAGCSGYVDSRVC